MKSLEMSWSEEAKIKDERMNIHQREMSENRESHFSEMEKIGKKGFICLQKTYTPRTSKMAEYSDSQMEGIDGIGEQRMIGEINGHKIVINLVRKGLATKVNERMPSGITALPYGNSIDGRPITVEDANQIIKKYRGMAYDLDKESQLVEKSDEDGGIELLLKDIL